MKKVSQMTYNHVTHKDRNSPLRKYSSLTDAYPTNYVQPSNIAANPAYYVLSIKYCSTKSRKSLFNTVTYCKPSKDSTS